MSKTALEGKIIRRERKKASRLTLGPETGAQRSKSRDVNEKHRSRETFNCCEISKRYTHELQAGPEVGVSPYKTYMTPAEA